MNFEITSKLNTEQTAQWQDLLSRADLLAQAQAERTVLVYEDGELVATGARDGAVLKYLAVSPLHRGEDLTASVLTELRRDAFAHGYNHLFLYTKPQNALLFSSLFFYPVVQSQNVLVMENKKDGLAQFLSTLPPTPLSGTVGALVMNCNPFTLGHKYLIEQAALENDHVFVFVLSEDKSQFSAEDRLRMVQLGTAHLKNVHVLPSGPYILSTATFPTYFLKDGAKTQHAACEVDIAIFTRHLAPRLAITRRYVGTEPTCAVTAQYNEMLKLALPQYGIEVREIARLCDGIEAISASKVRSLLIAGNRNALSRLLPETTLRYLEQKKYL